MVRKTFSELVQEATPPIDANIVINEALSQEARERRERISEAIARKQERDRNMGGVLPEALWGVEGAELISDFLGFMRTNDFAGSEKLAHKPEYSNMVHSTYNRHPQFKIETTFLERQRMAKQEKKAHKHDHHEMEHYDDTAPSFARGYRIGYVFDKKSAQKDLPLKSTPGVAKKTWPIQFRKIEDPSSPRPVYLCTDGLIRAADPINDASHITPTLGSLPLYFEHNVPDEQNPFDPDRPVQPYTGVLNNVPYTRVKHNAPLVNSNKPLEIQFIPLEDMLVGIAATFSPRP